MKFFEIKKGRKWTMVIASGMVSLNNYCKENGFTDWRMCGMMSRSELAIAKTTCEKVA